MSRRRRSIPLATVIPRAITLEPHSSIGLGLDLATTEKATSNPSALALVESVGSDFIVRLLVRWKTENPDVTYGILNSVLMAIAPRRARKLCIDATNERFFSTSVKARLVGLVPVDLIISSESTEYLGEKMSFKSFLGAQLVNEMEDGHVILPEAQWITDDFRLVKRDRGSFVTDLDESGGHGDTFDAVKLGIHASRSSGGPAAATAAQVGSLGKPRTGIWKNPFAGLHGQGRGGRINV